MIKSLKKILNRSLLTHIYREIIQRSIIKNSMVSFKNDYVHFNKSIKNKRFQYSAPSHPILNDKTPTTPFEPHYTYHPAWAARIIAKINPQTHTDISSTVSFCTIASAFLQIDFYDYRPADIRLTNLTCKTANLTNLHFESNSIASLSCMHTIEHIGLGRYGEPIDYDGDLKAIKELKRVVIPSGDLLIVIPIGKAKIEFNAHRIYSYEQIISYFDDFKLIEFTLIPDNYEELGLIENATKDQADIQNWGCGCFWFKKVL